MAVFTITKENFETQVIASQSPVIVELWAPWCVYCRRISPALDRLAEKLGDETPIGKINIDEEPELGEKLEAEVIPVLYLFKDGKRGEKLVAPSSQDDIEVWLASQLQR